MALFYQHNINGDTKVGIWKIEETDVFFLAHVPLKKEVTHPYKRLQHLAGRYLLPALFEDFPLKSILIADTRKPYLEDEQYHFSISHCGNYAAAGVSRSKRIGIDIELVTPRILRIAGKFLNEYEVEYLKEWQHLSTIYLELVTLLWSSKEAIFKWYGNGGVDFRNHIHLTGTIIYQPDEWIELTFVFDKEESVQLNVSARMFNGLVLAIAINGKQSTIS